MNIKPIIFLVVAAVVLGGLFLAFKPQKQAQNPSDSQSVAPIETVIPATSPGLKAKTFELMIKDKKIISGNKTMQASKGDEIVFKVTADRAGEFHLHGYDQDINLDKDTPGELRITANLTGRFDIEFHESETNKYEIGALEVLPK